MSASPLGVAVTPALFPCIFKDVESAVYVSECKVPTAESLTRLHLIVDNNVLGALKSSPLLFGRLGWLLGAGTGARGTTMHINPFFAAAEQYLSNPDNALGKIEAFTQHPGVFGTFAVDHGKRLLQDVRQREHVVRGQIGILVCYLFVLKEIFQSKATLKQRADAWIAFFNDDIPRVMLLYVMGMLFFFGRDDERLRFKGSNFSVRSWADGFLATRSEEVDEPARWVRNRVFDLLPFLMAPTLNWEAEGGLAGRLFLLTKDREIGECLLRIFVWHGEQSADSPWKLQANLECLHFEKHAEFQATAFGPVSARETDRAQRAARMTRLVDASLALLSPPRRPELLAALNEFRWLDAMNPGSAAT